ncbi:hypothetical protein LQV05_006374 [Cryptococcus neoformans]|nr:hypothetical protein LQV05_006374 [Cryptococcus neoformans]
MSRSPSPTLSDSALLDSLEDSFDYSAHREARMEALSRQIKQVKDLRESEYGRIVEFNEEKALIERMALIGFEELGQSDNFTTKALEFRLSQTGVLPTDLTLATNVSASILTHKQQGSRSGSEDEDSEEERDRRRGKSGIRSGFRNKRGGESGDDDW